MLAVTKREGEPPEAYADARPGHRGSPPGEGVRPGPQRDPARLAALDELTRARLTQKYAKMRKLLGLPHA